MAGNATLDTRYRAYPPDALDALIKVTLDQIIQIRATGQSHSANGQSFTMADLDTLQNNLSDMYAAKNFLESNNGADARRSLGMISRYADFSRPDPCASDPYA